MTWWVIPLMVYAVYRLKDEEFLALPNGGMICPHLQTLQASREPPYQNSLPLRLSFISFD
ncbi:hypothetical protein ACJ2PR_28540 [Phormidesmis sp. 146-33]